MRRGKERREGERRKEKETKKRTLLASPKSECENLAGYFSSIYHRGRKQ